MSAARCACFLTIDPELPHDAVLTFAFLPGSARPDGILSYRVKARLDASEPVPRIGLKGTAKLYGGEVPLAYAVFRRRSRRHGNGWVLIAAGSPADPADAPPAVAPTIVPPAALQAGRSPDGGTTGAGLCAAAGRTGAGARPHLARRARPDWTLYDPVINRFYRIGWLEFEILCRWHLRAPAEIAARIARETTLPATEADVEQFTRFSHGRQFAARGRGRGHLPPDGAQGRHAARLVHLAAAPLSCLSAFPGAARSRAGAGCCRGTGGSIPAAS